MRLRDIYIPENIDEILVSRADVNRPGLALTGFFRNFEAGRIQIIGNAEYNYLVSLEPGERAESIAEYFAREPVCTVLTSGLMLDEFVECARKHGSPVFSAQEKTSPFMAALINYLNVQLAPRITRHGVLVEVYGEGILILGESGIGKSETAVELVKRGHRLIADDAVELKKVSAITIIGTAPEIIRHYIEIRGIGIIDVKRIFGMGAVKMTEKIDLVIKLELWDQHKFYERLGLEDECMEILGINIPSVIVPVRPGRNLAIIIEIAAMNNRQKKLGYNTAAEFNSKILQGGSDEA